jgi:glycosyltransferase involved in cell wall biosynthesis
MSRPRWHIDEIARGRVRGWACDPSAPGERPVLDIILDGRFAGQVLANQNRADLREAGIGDGYHGFEWRHPGLIGVDAAQRIAVEWPRLGVWGRSTAIPAGTMGLRHFRSPKAYLAARHAALAAFSPASFDAGISAASPATRLLESAGTDALGPCRGKPISAYQSYVLHRFRMEPGFDPGLTAAEHRRFLRWYIQHYGSVRANLRIPLTEADLALLNTPIDGDAGRIEAMAIFAEDFAIRAGFEDADWAFSNSASLGLADVIEIASAQSEAQRLTLFASHHPILRALNAADPETRRDLLELLAVLHPQLGKVRPRIETAYLPIPNQKAVDVQIIGPFSKALGVGESCRRMARALAMTDFSLRTCDFSIDYPNEGLTDIPFTLEEPGPARVNILHLNLDEIPKVVAYWPDVFSGAINIAVPYLELSRLAPEHELGLALVHQVFAATEHIRTVIGERLPVDVVGSAVELTDLPDRAAARQAALGPLCGPEDFVVLVSSDALSGLDRKNITGAVRAFLAAFPDDPACRLIIKTHSIRRTNEARQQRIWDNLEELAAENPRIILLEKHLDAAAYHQLQAACDVYLTLHRAEGLGYHVLESMQLGIPCIVTDYSGTRDFSTAETALQVGYHMAHVPVWAYPFTRGEQQWAEPDLEAAVRHLRALAASPDRGRSIGLRGRQLIHDHYCLPAFARRLKALLEPIIAVASTPQRG